MQKDFLNKFSNELIEHRKKKGVTLEQISQSTKINIKFLKAIEEADFEIMPEVYIRAFIKSYAENIGLEPSDVLADFELAKKGKFNKTFEEEIGDNFSLEDSSSTPSDSPTPESSFNDDELPSEHRNRKRQLLLIGIIVPILLVVSYFLFFQDEKVEAVEETPFSEVLENRKIEPQEIELNKPVVVLDSTLNLRLEADDKCWVRVIIDSKDTSEYSFVNKSIKNFTAKNNFSLLIGNSGGIKIYLNNEQLEFGGRSGKVLSCDIDKNGVRISENKLNE